MKIQSENVKKRKTKTEVTVDQGRFSSRFPLLFEKARYWGFKIPTNQPLGTKCAVWRLPPVHEHKIPGTDGTGVHGTILIPDDHESPHVKGVLVGAGLMALQRLEADGVTLGHTVQFKRYAGDEMQDHEDESLRGQRLIWIEASDIIASDELRDALEMGTADFIKDDDGKMHMTVAGDIPGARKQISAKKKKLLALATNPTAAPQERANARKSAHERE